MKKLFKIVFVLGAIFFSSYCIASDNYVEANKINSVETVSFPSIKGETYIPVEFTSYYEVDLGGTVKWMVSPSENAYLTIVKIQVILLVSGLRDRVNTLYLVQMGKEGR